VSEATAESHSEPSRFPATIADDHRTILDKAGRPWASVGDAAWSSIVMLHADERNAYLERIVGLHYDAVIVNVVENYYSEHPPKDADGNAPFDGALFSSAPSPDYWAGVDDYVQESARLGVTMLMCVAYLGYADDGVAEALQQATVDDAFEYGRFLGDRYRAAPNILWVMGGDRTDVAPDLLDRVDAIARGVRSAGDTHLMASHAGDGVLGSDVYGQFPWLDIDTVYDITHDLVADTHRAMTTEPTRPVLAIEALYESDRENPLPPGDPYLRYQSWAPFMAGTFGQVFGNNPRWLFGSTTWSFGAPTTWQLSLNDPAGVWDRSTIEQGYLAQFAEQWDWASAPPDIDQRFVTASDGNDLAAGRFRQGLGMVYVPDGTRVQVDLAALGSPTLSITRFDPTDGTSTSVPTPAALGLFDLPDERNARGAGDWVYVFDGE
jgi:hypothetical protein